MDLPAAMFGYRVWSEKWVRQLWAAASQEGNADRRCLDSFISKGWVGGPGLCEDASATRATGAKKHQALLPFSDFRGNLNFIVKLWLCKEEAIGCAWGLSGFPVLATWSQNTNLAKPWKGWLFVTWLYWDIEISKPPYVPFPKMIELCLFMYFLGLSEIYFNWQSLPVTLTL